MTVSPTMPARLTIEMPAWLTATLPTLPTRLTNDTQRMRLVNQLAERNHLEGTGGPFAALTTDTGTGELLSVGVNLVLASGLSTAHAEVVALSIAEARLCRWDLGADDAVIDLTVNWRPCVMCYGAAMWSGIRRLVIAGEGPELEQLTGFDEGPMRPDWAEQFEDRGITVVQDVLRDEAVNVFRRYGDRRDAVVYNARSASPGQLGREA